MRRPRLTDVPPPPKGNTGWPWTVESPALRPLRHDGSSWPCISIVTPSYNQGAFIEETIRSILLQGYPELEYIIIDGGSTDESVGIIKKYERWLTFWVSEKDDGQSDAINRGFARSTGTVLTWLNSDDFLLPGALGAIGEAFAGVGETVGAIVGAGHKIDEQYRPFYSPRPRVINRETLLTMTGMFMQPACFFKKSAWEQCGPIRVDLQYCMDFAFWLEMSKVFDFSIIANDISYAHAHKDAKTVAQRKHMFAEIAIVLAQQPDGFAIARRLAMDLVDGKLVSDNVPAKELTKELMRRVVARFRRQFSTASEESKKFDHLAE